MTAVFAMIFDSGSVLAASLAFFAVSAAVAYVTFRLLKKTVKMAFRMAAVAAIMLVAVIGVLSFWWFGSGTTQQKQRPATSRAR